MKINEILISEEPEARPDSPQTKNLKDIKPDKTPGGTGRPGSAGGGQKYTAAEYSNMITMYKGRPEMVRLIQFALAMPHIQNIEQAIMYANTEISARASLSAQPHKDIKPDRTTGTDWTGKQGRPRYGFDRGGSLKDALPSGLNKSSVPGLDLVKQAAAAVVDGVGHIAQGGGLIDPDKKTFSVTGELSKWTTKQSRRAQDIAKDIRG